MTSTLTGNFDLCIEVTEAVLTGFASSTFGGTKQHSQFDKVVVGGVAISGQATLLIDSAAISVDPSRSPRGLVTITFADSAFTLTAPVTANAMPLAGSMVASVPFRLPAPTGGFSNLQLDFADPSVTVNVKLDSASQAHVAEALARVGFSGLSAAQIQNIIDQALKAALASKPGTMSVPNARFGLVPGKDGTLGPPLQFSDMALVTRPAGAGMPGVLCILGTLLNSHVQKENIGNKTVTATDRSHQGSVSMSPEAFQGLFVNRFVGAKPAGLTGFSVTLEEGRIAIHATGTISGTGWSADATIDAHMTLGLAGGVLTPTVVVDSLSTDVSLDWWVWVLGGGLVPGIVDTVANALAGRALQAAVSDLVSKIHGVGIPLGGLGDAFTLNAVQIHTQGIVFQGQAPIAAHSSVTAVRGMVADPSEAPISDATVMVNSIQLATDSSGLYHLAVAPGVYSIRAEQEGFVPSAKVSVTAQSSKTVTLDFTLERTKPLTLTGRVVGDNGAPIAGATITLGENTPVPWQSTAMTNSTGLYSITMDPVMYDGSYSVRAGADGFLPGLVDLPAIPNGASITQDFVLTATHPFTIMGQVVGGGGPINQVEIFVETVNEAAGFGGVPPNQNYAAHTDARGNYSITVNPGPYAGGYVVTAIAKDFGASKLSVAQSSDATFTVNFALSPVPPAPPRDGTGPHGGVSSGGGAHNKM